MTRRAIASKPSVTIVTTCMQRLAFLKQSLPTWLEYTSFPIIVVDYSCPEGAAAWIEQSMPKDRVSVVHCEAKRLEGRPVFNPSRARNAGAGAVGKGYLLFLDSDTQLKAGFQEWIEAALTPDAMLAVVGKASPLFGALGVHREKFQDIHGYDEGFTGWGGEDLDIRIRLHLQGLKCAAIPEGLMHSLPHSNDLRSRNSAEPDFNKARRLNGDYLNNKLVRTTGRSFHSWITDPHVDCLCQKPRSTSFQNPA